MSKRDGFEPVDDTPVAVPVKFTRPPGEIDRMREMMIRLSKEMGERGLETLEDSLDFDIEDDDDGPISPSETRLMAEERLLTETEEAARVALQRKEAAEHYRRYYGRRKDGKQGVHAAAGGSDAARSGDVKQESRASDSGGDGLGRDGGVAEKKG